MNLMKLSSCDLCQHDEFDSVSNTDRDGQQLDTVICKQCGLVRHAVVPTEEELHQFYSTNYREAYNGERTPGARRIMRAWNNGERICRQVAPLLEPQSRLLEVGAGIGCTVKVFEKNGFSAEGIDPGGEFLSFSQDKLHANVQVRDLYSLQSDHSYDTALLIHVIEHLRSPRQALEHIAGLLKPGGIFYVECPNLQAPFARRSKLFHTAHIHNFVPSSLQMLAESCGFRLRQRFGDEQDVNLQMLFQHSGTPRLQINTSNVDRTVRELNRANTLPYLMRTRYLTDRLRKVGSYGREYVRAKDFVAGLIKDSSTGDVSDQIPSRAA
jgi:2-polyprenyl-3-methyl-5-hydroxy-6-metoxy-1,4-benzoquinol methylase